MPASHDEAEDLRREMEAHLSYLEDEARTSGGSSGDAARRASERFGNAVEHFRAALEDMTVRQRTLRQLLVAGLVGGAVTLVGGVVAAVLILRSVESDLTDMRAELAASNTSLNQATVSCVVLVARWADPPGRPNTLRMPVTVDAWSAWLQTAGLDCGPGESPGFLWKSQGWVASGYHIPEGLTVWFTVERMQEMSPELAGTAATAFKAVTAQSETARCLPTPTRTQAGL